MMICEIAGRPLQQTPAGAGLQVTATGWVIHVTQHLSEVHILFSSHHSNPFLSQPRLLHSHNLYPHFQPIVLTPYRSIMWYKISFIHITSACIFSTGTSLANFTPLPHFLSSHTFYSQFKFHIHIFFTSHLHS